MKKLCLYLSFFIFSSSFSYAQYGTISTIAGENNGNNVTGTGFGINPYSMVPDNLGNLYIADASNHMVRKLNISTGKLTVVAGNGSYGYTGDGGQATDAQLVYPLAVALDKLHNLYVVDESDQCVRKINLTTGVISTAVGNGNWGFGGDNGPATAAKLNNPVAIAIDTANNIYISDYSNNRIRKVSKLGIITTIAGYDSTGYNKDSIPADSARLNGPAGIALDKAGNIYFADQNNCRIRMIRATTDTIYTLSGGTAGFSGDGGPATKAQFWYPLGITVDPSGNVYIADTYENRLREITIANDTITTICGNGNSSFAGDGGPASAAEIFQPHYITFDALGNLFIADMGNNRIREILASNGNITTLSGDGLPGDNGNNISALTSQLSYPTDVASDNSGNIYIAEVGNNMIREVDYNTGNILKIAGTGISGFSGDGGPAGKAQFNGPNEIAINDSGNIFIADEYNNRIREINTVTNTIKTIAGNGTAGFAGDHGQATSAELFYPMSVAIDSKGDIFIADMINDRVREVIAVNHNIITVAGNGYNSKNYGGGFSGDGGPAISAELNQPQGVAVDNSNNLYIADTWNDRIRKVNLTSGIITTVAGTGNWNYTGDGGPATAADLGIPTSIRLDVYGNLYISDYYNNAVRQVSFWDGTITTIAGTGNQSYSGDGGPAVNADLDLAHSTTFDPSGNMYIADYGNNRVRKVTAPLGINNLSRKDNISVYPNPSSTEIYINVNGFNNDPATMEITDLTGRTVIQRDINKVFSTVPINVNISGLPDGIYIVNIRNSSQSFTSKIVKE